MLNERVNRQNAYATKDIATSPSTCASAPGPPTTDAITAGPTMTPAVGPWMPTESATVRPNASEPRRRPGGEAEAASACTRASRSVPTVTD